MTPEPVKHARKVGRGLARMIRDGMEQPVANVREYYRTLATAKEWQANGPDNTVANGCANELMRKHGVHKEHRKECLHVMRAKLLELL